MRKLITVALLALATYGGIGWAPDPSSAGAAGATVPAYQWPVKPFDRPHPVRGGFGDPRTVFSGSPSNATLMTGSGAFQFHFGIDISAPNGTAVYPVMSGTVTTVTRSWVGVDSGGGRTFQYWHVDSAVSPGEHVDGYTTVVGHITRGAGHVHLTEIDNGVVVNPLAPGHLGPYEDHTSPRVASIEFRRDVGSASLMPELLRGSVEMIASAYDVPTLHVPGEWHDLPVTPALVEWRIQSARNGRIVIPSHVVYDVRQTIPPNSHFWSVYARGTRQNMSVFGKHYSYMQPGAYLFRLVPGGFDTRTLGDDVYELVVTVTDIRGNSSSSSQRFSVHNRPGVVGE